MDRPILELSPGDAWAVGVSGGADSVALLLLLRDRPNLKLHVAHLNHQLRGPQSDADESFVRDLADRLQLPCHVARRGDIEPQLADLPSNPSARYRAIRLEFFHRLVAQEQLTGVLLAHHADDVAETVLHRLLRGSGPAGLTGIAPLAHLSGLQIARPLLNVRSQSLRAFLTERRQPWREDASNQSADYLRNRLRKILAAAPALTASLLELAAANRTLADWMHRAAPKLPAAFAPSALASLPSILARASAQTWLIAAGAPKQQLKPADLQHLITMAADAATPHVQMFPGRLSVRRAAGKIAVADSPTPS